MHQQPNHKVEPHTFIPSAYEKRGEIYCGHPDCGMLKSNAVHRQGVPDERLDRTAYYVALAQLQARRSTCVRGRVGAVIVRDGRVIASGYNGAPPGMPHCIDVGCEPADGCERTVHAEANAIAWAARAGIATEGATMICTHGPCRACAQLIASCGIAEFWYLKEYRLQRIDILEQCGVKTVDRRAIAR